MSFLVVFVFIELPYSQNKLPNNCDCTDFLLCRKIFSILSVNRKERMFFNTFFAHGLYVTGKRSTFFYRWQSCSTWLNPRLFRKKWICSINISS